MSGLSRTSFCEQIIEDRKKDIQLLEQENVRIRDAAYLERFQPVRPSRNAAHISALIAEKGVHLKGIQDTMELIGIQLALHHQNDLSPDEQESLAECTEELAKLRCEHATTYAHQEQLRCVLSPIRVLPVEILTEIFERCCDPTNDLSLSSAPMLVSHVCAAWRKIVIHRGHLWSSLRVNTDHFATKAHGLLPLAKTWLDRSGNFPLRIVITRSDDLGNTMIPCDLFIDLLKLYVPHFGRWKDFVLKHTQFSGHNVSLFSAIPDDGSFPFLERFELYLRTMNAEDARKLCRLFHQAPRLQQLAWSVMVSAGLSFPYSQLKTLHVGGNNSITRVRRILSEGKHLQKIDISIVILPSASASKFPHILHQSLSTITFGFGGNSVMLFDSMTLPTLREFNITNIMPFFYSTWSQAAFLSFLMRSKCTLTSFGISDYDLTPPNVLEILSVLSPSLVNVGFEHARGRWMTDDVLTALTYPRGRVGVDEMPSILCPRLKNLKIIGCLSSTDGILADMVESRFNPPATLTQLEIGFFGIDSSRQPRDSERVMALALSDRLNVDYLVLEERTRWSGDLE